MLSFTGRSRWLWIVHCVGQSVPQWRAVASKQDNPEEFVITSNFVIPLLRLLFLSCWPRRPWLHGGVKEVGLERGGVDQDCAFFYHKGCFVMDFTKSLGSETLKRVLVTWLRTLPA